MKDDVRTKIFNKIDCHRGMIWITSRSSVLINCQENSREAKTSVFVPHCCVDSRHSRLSSRRIVPTTVQIRFSFISFLIWSVLSFLLFENPKLRILLTRGWWWCHNQGGRNSHCIVQHLLLEYGDFIKGLQQWHLFLDRSDFIKGLMAVRSYRHPHSK